VHKVKYSTLVKRFLFVPAILTVIALLLVAVLDNGVLGGSLGFVWVEELCVIITFWIIFLSIFFIDRENLHIRIRIVTLSPRLEEVVEDLCMVIFDLFLVVSALMLWPNLYSHYSALEWPMKVGYLAIIVGGVLALVGKIAKWGDRIWNRCC